MVEGQEVPMETEDGGGEVWCQLAQLGGVLDVEMVRVRGSYIMCMVRGKSWLRECQFGLLLP